MFRLIKFLFTGDWHLHKWKVIIKSNVKHQRGEGYSGTLYVLQCEHCGDLKKHHFGV